MTDKAPNVIDQKQTSSCAPCATRTMFATSEMLANHPDPKPSPVDLYYRINGGADRGADLAACMDELKRNGICSTDHAALIGVNDPQHLPGWENDRASHKIAAYNFCETEQDIANEVAAGKPVLFGTVVTSAFNPNNQATIGPAAGRPIGGHALAAIGVKQQPDGRYYRIQNSWGDQWGDGGRAWIHQSWMRPEIYGAFSIDVIRPTDLPTTDQAANAPNSNACANGRCGRSTTATTTTRARSRLLQRRTTRNN
jgi:hypothetical protein